MWSEQPIVGFDTETTGVDPTRERLVTASVIVVDGQGARRHYWLANPEVEIPLQAQNVHGISTEQARREGEPIGKVLNEVAELLAHHMAAGHPVVAYNAAYDFTLIECELERHGLPTLAERLGHEVGPVVDPYMLDRSVDRYRKGKRRLENLAEHYGVADDDSFHNAEADVLATLRVLGAMLRRYPELAHDSLDHLMDVQRQTYTEFQQFMASRNGQQLTGPLPWPVAK
ncbi:DNA polymerase III subunit epsilon [Arcanobacterium phocisimile]|uniref:DNA polymerase III subunit epsilon n=1 Tax=Arcanobacterium phocisimile TaxID=1302235 RepID=A0ABX7IGA2_9ACTO|nr:exonuclease domain-containing protein [Arcanobacterium phocisimile]QRV01785.1 DNA polymerase III subunit epsilon [Arcanobacterium phocisimile]